MHDELTALDATFLELEQHDGGALMHIGGVMVFEPLPAGATPTRAQVCDGIGARLAALPRYRQRLSDSHVGGLQWPHWVPDERFDVRAHVRRVALPAPGGEAELAEWAADFYSHPLDRRRPLWELVLIEGLADGGWALAHKTHHSLVDGVGSVDVAGLMLDDEPVAPAPDPPLVPLHPEGSVLSELLPRPRTLVQVAQAGARATGAGLDVIRHPQTAWKRSRAVAELLVRDELIGAPPSSINVPIGSTRRFAVMRTELRELKEIGAALGGSVNDAVLAACTAGLRELLLARGEELPRRGLRAMVPVNLRRDAEHLGLGNRVSSLFVDLPVAEPIAGARHHRIVTRTGALKRAHAAEGAETALGLAALAPPVIHATLARLLYANRLFNVTITNVPGPVAPLYAFGARLREIWPIVPLAADHAVGIAVFSYAGTVTFGVIADADATPDIDELVTGIQAGLEELSALAHGLALAHIG